MKLPRPMPVQFFVPTREIREVSETAGKTYVVGELGHLSLKFEKMNDDHDANRMHSLRQSFWMALEMERLGQNV